VSPEHLGRDDSAAFSAAEPLTAAFVTERRRRMLRVYRLSRFRLPATEKLRTRHERCDDGRPFASWTVHSRNALARARARAGGGTTLAYLPLSSWALQPSCKRGACRLCDKARGRHDIHCAWGLRCSHSCRRSGGIPARAPGMSPLRTRRTWLTRAAYLPFTYANTWRLRTTPRGTLRDDVQHHGRQHACRSCTVTQPPQRGLPTSHLHQTCWTTTRTLYHGRAAGNALGGVLGVKRAAARPPTPWTALLPAAKARRRSAFRRSRAAGRMGTGVTLWDCNLGRPPRGTAHTRATWDLNRRKMEEALAGRVPGGDHQPDAAI